MGVGDTTGIQFTVDTDVLVAGTSYAVLAVDGDPLNNGGLPVVDYDYPGSLFGLLNSSDAVSLYNGATTVDSVSYDNGATFPNPVGASMSLSATGFTTSRNDQGSYRCEATSFIDGDPSYDRGTPGDTNDGC